MSRNRHGTLRATTALARVRRTVADEPHCAVRTAASDQRAGTIVAPHRHGWHQLICVVDGLMTVTTDVGSWVAPPTWAVWVPAGVVHGIRFVAASALRTVFFRPDAVVALPAACTVVAVTPLLRELVVRATAIGMLDGRHGADAALATLMTAELRHVDTPPFALPEPASAPLRAATRALAASDPASVAALAEAAGLGVRTFERRFKAETGMTPGRWRQQRRLLDALETLAAGRAIKVAAARAGYATPSAFVAAFRRVFGTTPGRYFA